MRASSNTRGVCLDRRDVQHVHVHSVLAARIVAKVALQFGVK